MTQGLRARAVHASAVAGTDICFLLLFNLITDPSKNINDSDGLKIDFSDSWVQLRKSNTEPIIRIYSEARTQQAADQIADKFINEIESII